MPARQLQQTADIATGQVRNSAGQMAPTIASKAYELQAAKSPAEIAHLEAGSEQAQIRIKAIEQANALHAQKLKSIADMEFVDLNPAANAEFYRQQRANAEAAHQANLARLQGAGASSPPQAPSGVRTWNPNLPNGGL